MPAFIFPGQGSQRPGMGRPWRDHPSWDVVEDASAITGRDVAHLLLDARTDELTETRNAQLATLVMGLVTLDAVERLGVEPTACAGHSLGEYTALVAAGAIGFDDALRLVAERGEAMQEAALDNPGIMLAIAGLDDEMVRIACLRADGDVWLANSNAPGDCVIAGRPEEARRAARIARELGATRVTPLAVGAAFHTPLMAPAQARLRKALESTTFYPLGAPVVANVDAMAHSSPDEWPSLLSAQLRSPVRWRQSTLTLASLLGVPEGPGTPEGRGTPEGPLFVELGPGGTLSKMARATLPSAATLQVAVPDDLDVLVATLTGEGRGRGPSHAAGASRGPARYGAEPTLDETLPAHHEGERLYLSERIIVSPCAGLFELIPRADELGALGRHIEVGDLVGLVSGAEVRSPFAGELMGVLAHPGERVQPGQPLAWLRSD
jgi:[acyl-carrier-protein] S-malonyltransferase